MEKIKIKQTFSFLYGAFPKQCTRSQIFNIRRSTLKFANTTINLAVVKYCNLDIGLCIQVHH